MKTLAISTLAVLSASLISAAEPVLSQQERDHAIQLLRDSKTEFLNLTSGLSESQWTYKPLLESSLLTRFQNPNPKANVSADSNTWAP